MASLRDFLICAHPVLPVIVIEDLDHAVPLAEALLQSGIEVIELTLRSACAMAAIEAIKKALPEMTVGVGTVTEGKQIPSIISAGADFAVSPGIRPKLLASAQQHKLPILPGVMTPSDILIALQHDLKLVKLFPAAIAGGTPYLKALMGPFPTLEFCPTGGINGENYQQYLAQDNVLCVGGSWLTPPALIKQQRWDDIKALVRALPTAAVHRESS